MTEPCKTFWLPAIFYHKSATKPLQSHKSLPRAAVDISICAQKKEAIIEEGSHHHKTLRRPENEAFKVRLLIKSK